MQAALREAQPQELPSKLSSFWEQPKRFGSVFLMELEAQKGLMGLVYVALDGLTFKVG